MVNAAGMALAVEVTRTRVLAPMADTLADATPVTAAAGDWLRQRQARVFATGGAGAWPADDPVTLLYKTGPRTLVDTGGLLDALSSESAPGSRYSYGPDSVTVATDLVQALMAQRGAHGAPKRNPAPPLTRAEVEDVTGVILDAIMRPAR